MPIQFIIFRGNQRKIDAKQKIDLKHYVVNKTDSR